MNLLGVQDFFLPQECGVDPCEHAVVFLHLENHR